MVSRLLSPFTTTESVAINFRRCSVKSAGKHRFDMRRDLEQTVVKHDRRLVCDRRELGEALLHEFDLVGCHGLLHLRSLCAGLTRASILKRVLHFRSIAGSSPVTAREI